VRYCTEPSLEASRTEKRKIEPGSEKQIGCPWSSIHSSETHSTDRILATHGQGLLWIELAVTEAYGGLAASVLLKSRTEERRAGSQVCTRYENRNERKSTLQQEWMRVCLPALGTEPTGVQA
jgi:hypothetical protein